MKQKTLTERLEIRLSPQDKAAIEAHARESGVSPTVWVRRRLLLDRAREQK